MRNYQIITSLLHIFLLKILLSYIHLLIIRIELLHLLSTSNIKKPSFSTRRFFFNKNDTMMNWKLLREILLSFFIFMSWLRKKIFKEQRQEKNDKNSINLDVKKNRKFFLFELKSLSGYNFHFEWIRRQNHFIFHFS